MLLIRKLQNHKSQRNLICKRHKNKAMIAIRKYIKSITLIVLMFPFVVNGQDFPTDYFSPKPIANQPRSNNSFL